MSTSANASRLAPPVIRIENMSHPVFEGTAHGYFQDFGVWPVMFVRGHIRISPDESKDADPLLQGETLELQTDHRVLGWSQERPLLRIQAGDREVCVEPGNGETWERIIFRPSFDLKKREVLPCPQ